MIIITHILSGRHHLETYAGFSWIFVHVLFMVQSRVSQEGKETNLVINI